MTRAQLVTGGNRHSIPRILVTTVILLQAACLQSPIPEPCRRSLDAQLSGWRLATVRKDVSDWANQAGLNPVLAAGDFDGDRRNDQAILVEHEAKRKVAVCFSTAEGTNVVMIDHPYCRDYISTSKAGELHENLDTQKPEVLGHDGISVACFEQAGATYVYEGDAFREIVDSD